MSDFVDIFNQEQITTALTGLLTRLSGVLFIEMPPPGWVFTYGNPRTLPLAGGACEGELVTGQYRIEFVVPAENRTTVGFSLVSGSGVSITVTTPLGSTDVGLPSPPAGIGIGPVTGSDEPRTIVVYSSAPFGVNITFGE